MRKNIRSGRNQTTKTGIQKQQHIGNGKKNAKVWQYQIPKGMSSPWKLHLGTIRKITAKMLNRITPVKTSMKARRSRLTTRKKEYGFQRSSEVLTRKTGQTSLV